MRFTPFYFNYRFKLKNNDILLFDIKINPETLNVINIAKDRPEWTRLSYKQCDCCTLDTDRSPYCPAALNIISFVKEAAPFNSSDYCTASCKMPSKNITLSKEIMIQDGLASILFLILIASLSSRSRKIQTDSFIPCFCVYGRSITVIWMNLKSTKEEFRNFG